MDELFRKPGISTGELVTLTIQQLRWDLSREGMELHLGGNEETVERLHQAILQAVRLLMNDPPLLMRVFYRAGLPETLIRNGTPDEETLARELVKRSMEKVLWRRLGGAGT